MKYSKGWEIVLWLLQIVTAAFFVMAAYPKLMGDPMMVAMFGKIGLGQWFRYLTGVLEILGAILLVVPGLAGFGGVLLTAVMLGAVLTHLTVLGGNPSPAVLALVLSAVIAWFRKDQVLRRNL